VFEVIHPDTLSKALPGPVRSEGKISPRKNNQPTDPVVARKRLFVGLGLVLLMALIFSDPTERVKTFRERAKIDINPETEANKNVKKDDVKWALSDVVPNYKEDARGGDAEVFFKAGVRELQSKNFRRALTSFDTALAVDPNHDLAKVYKEITRKEFDKEVDLAIKAAIRARKALRYKEARMHYQTVLRYMSGDKLNVKYVEAEEALKLLDKIEHEGI
jgi:tetratricopeptide (TPR) repeat protein